MRTLLSSPALDASCGGRILVKAECLQRGSPLQASRSVEFHLTIAGRGQDGRVVAYSSGNHAQGVAAAAALRGLPAVIVMPEDAPEIKKANTRSYGAELVTYDRQAQSREEPRAIARERGAVLVPPYEHPWIVAGQGRSGRRSPRTPPLSVSPSIRRLLVPVAAASPPDRARTRDAVARDRDLHGRARAVR